MWGAAPVLALLLHKVDIKEANFASSFLLFHRHRLQVLKKYKKERKKIFANRVTARKRELIKTEPSASSTNIFSSVNKNGSVRAIASQIYVNAQSGNDSRDGSSAAFAVWSLSRALTLVKNKPHPLTSVLVVNLSGTFERERIILNENHAGTSSSAKVIFRGDLGNSLTRLLGGNTLSFVKVPDLESNHPARQLANNGGTSINDLYAAPPPPNFPSNIRT